MLAGTTGVAAGVDSPDVELWRLDCGEFPDFDIERWSDVFAYPGKTKTFANGCYLIRHEQHYMLWDTGLSPAAVKRFDGFGMKSTMGTALVDQLSRIGVDPKQVSVIGISHGAPDHTGQAARFPGARLLIGKPDFEWMVQNSRDDIAPWATERPAIEKLSGDKDVFGDGSIVMLATPGHTMGHYALLVRLPKFGPVILAGDLWHFSEQVPHNGMPPVGRGTTDRAAALASMDRILKAAANLKAKVVIQHEKGDIPKLPLFPSSAR